MATGIQKRPNGPEPTPPAQADEGSATKRALGMLQKSYDKIADVSPSYLTPERMIQVVSAMVYRTPRLQECEPASIVNSVIRAASLGIDLDPALMEGYLIPRWNDNIKAQECQFQLGYQGIRKHALNTGKVSYIQSRGVYERDIFSYQFDPDLVFQHVPHLGADRGKISHVYCVAKLNDGEHVIEVMTTDEIEEIHRRSEGYKKAKKNGWTESGPWVTDWLEMAKKTVLKRDCKSVPRSLELAKVIEYDNEDYRDDGPESIERKPNSRTEELKRRLQRPTELPSVAIEPPRDEPWEQGAEAEDSHTPPPEPPTKPAKLPKEPKPAKPTPPAPEAATEAPAAPESKPAPPAKESKVASTGTLDDLLIGIANDSQMTLAEVADAAAVHLLDKGFIFKKDISDSDGVRDHDLILKAMAPLFRKNLAKLTTLINEGVAIEIQRTEGGAE